jgi:hypothetical protein
MRSLAAYGSLTIRTRRAATIFTFTRRTDTPRSAAWLLPSPCNRSRLRACALVRERPAPPAPRAPAPGSHPAGVLPAASGSTTPAYRPGTSCTGLSQIALEIPGNGQLRRRPTDGERIPLAHAVTLPQHPTSALLQRASPTRSSVPLNRDGCLADGGGSIARAADEETTSGKRWRLKTPASVRGFPGCGQACLTPTTSPRCTLARARQVVGVFAVYHTPTSPRPARPAWTRKPHRRGAQRQDKWLRTPRTLPLRTLAC